MCPILFRICMGIIKFHNWSQSIHNLQFPVSFCLFLLSHSVLRNEEDETMVVDGVSLFVASMQESSWFFKHDKPTNKRKVKQLYKHNNDRRDKSTMSNNNKHIHNKKWSEAPSEKRKKWPKFLLAVCDIVQTMFICETRYCYNCFKFGVCVCVRIFSSPLVDCSFPSSDSVHCASTLIYFRSIVCETFETLTPILSVFSYFFFFFLPSLYSFGQWHEWNCTTQ